MINFLQHYRLFAESRSRPNADPRTHHADPRTLPHDPRAIPHDPRSVPHDPRAVPHDPRAVPHDPRSHVVPRFADNYERHKRPQQFPQENPGMIPPSGHHLSTASPSKSINNQIIKKLFPIGDKH